MITEQQQEVASLYALGALAPEEQSAFEAQLRSNAELREAVLGFQRAAENLAASSPQFPLPAGLKEKIFAQIENSRPRNLGVPAGLRFLQAAGQSSWKELPVPGAYVKLLSVEKERGYAVLLGKLDPGVRYPAHVNVGPEDLYILTGDLVIGDRRLVAGDFHHADKDSQHELNYSLEGCTLLAVLTIEDPIVAYAMA